MVIGMANPITLVHLIGGIHNDAVMIALMVVALALARRRHHLLAVLLMIAATAVKLPAAAGLAFVGWQLPYARNAAQRMLAAGLTSLLGFGTTVILTFAMGMQLGWISALKGTSKIMSTFAPTTMVGVVLADAFHLVGFDVDTNAMVSASRLCGLAGAGLLAFWLLRHSERFGSERALACVMVLTVLFGPVLWPWYSAVAFIMLAASGIARFRMACIVWGAALTFFVYPTSVGSQVGLAQYQAFLGMSLLAGLTLLAVFAQALVGDPAAPGGVVRFLAAFRRRRLTGDPELVHAASN